MESLISAQSSGILDNGSFDITVAALQAHFHQVVERNGTHLFAVETGVDLYELYLSHLPSERGYHTCKCCQQFITRFGSLASVNEDGSLTAAVWTNENVPEFYRAAVAAMAKAVERGEITGVALTEAEVWGTPKAGDWTHFAITAPKNVLFHGSRALTASQVAAAKLEDHRTLLHGLHEYNRDAVALALTLLNADSLYSGEKVIGPARFLLALHDIRATHKGRHQDNLIWQRVAGAPVGFCQPRSSMIGTLLDDIKAGYDFDDIKRRFAAKMHPLQYLRPQAPPTAGNIKQAERLVEQLGIVPSLERRFARLEEIPTIWRPAPAPTKAPAASGVFDHLKPQSLAERRQQVINMDPTLITWQKFAATVLPKALKMEVYLQGRMNLCALLTALVNLDAPPILQWDLPEDRNPVSWYVYHKGSSVEEWGLESGSWGVVSAVTLQPSMWSGDRYEHHGRSAILVIEGAQDKRQGGLGLFPGILKSELHAVRGTIEAHSNSRQPQGVEEGSANGLRVGHPDTDNLIRVTTSIGVAAYHIERWD